MINQEIKIFHFHYHQVDISNEDNFNKLLISILKTLSFRLNLCILNISIYVIKLFRPFLHLHQLLIKIKLYLHF